MDLHAPPGANPAHFDHSLSYAAMALVGQIGASFSIKPTPGRRSDQWTSELRQCASQQGILTSERLNCFHASIWPSDNKMYRLEDIQTQGLVYKSETYGDHLFGRMRVLVSRAHEVFHSWWMEFYDSDVQSLKVGRVFRWLTRDSNCWIMIGYGKVIFAGLGR